MSEQAVDSNEGDVRSSANNILAVIQSATTSEPSKALHVSSAQVTKVPCLTLHLISSASRARPRLWYRVTIEMCSRKAMAAYTPLGDEKREDSRQH
jgi:hypothetical protein